MLHDKETLTGLTALWGVQPITTVKEAQASKMIQRMLRSLEKREILNKKGLYICTVGLSCWDSRKVTNTIKF
ncbi:hypothetical protein MASR2M54_18260 [Aliarcobacter cryaerophilus]